MKQLASQSKGNSHGNLWFTGRAYMYIKNTLSTESTSSSGFKLHSYPDMCLWPSSADLFFQDRRAMQRAYVGRMMRRFEWNQVDLPDPEKETTSRVCCCFLGVRQADGRAINRHQQLVWICGLWGAAISVACKNGIPIEIDLKLYFGAWFN